MISSWQRHVALAVLALAAAGAACGRSPEAPAEAADGRAPAGSGPATSAARAPAAETAGAPEAASAARPAPSPGRAAIAWEDPEPPGAQARAEQAVGAEWNRDKTTRLTMRMSPLVDRTTGLAGFASGLATTTASLDDRLARLGAKVSDTEVTIRLPGSILFDFDSADLRSDAEATLAEVAGVLAEMKGRPIRIEGHTDSIASEEYNLQLSERRAAAVEAWLAGHGVEARRMTTVGLGESRPVADNSTAGGRQQNRRVEVVVGRGAGT